MIRTTTETTTVTSDNNKDDEKCNNDHCKCVILYIKITKERKNKHIS